MFDHALNDDAMTDVVATQAQAGVMPDPLASDAALHIWQRPPDTDLAHWLSRLGADQQPQARLTLQADSAPEVLQTMWQAQGVPASMERQRLLDDVVGWLAWFSRHTQCPAVCLRLETLTNNACRRWHQDSVPLRLITTYVGPGTEWVAPEHSQSVLANADADSAFAQSLKPFDVGLFRGRGFPGQAQQSGIVHRSPRIEGLGLTRLVLVLDVPKTH